jgi:hypothetical protein
VKDIEARRIAENERLRREHIDPKLIFMDFVLHRLAIKALELLKEEYKMGLNRKSRLSRKLWTKIKNNYECYYLHNMNNKKSFCKSYASYLRYKNRIKTNHFVMTTKIVCDAIRMMGSKI